MSRLVEHARRELELCGQTEEDPAYAAALVAAVAAFASYGHSGGSAGVAVEQLHRLLQFQTLSPLTSDPSEWEDRSALSGRPFWQNNRDSRAFSEDGGKTWHNIGEQGTWYVVGEQARGVAEVSIKVHEIAADGVPDMERFAGRVAFIFDGNIVMGWPIHVGEGGGSDYSGLWEANPAVGRTAFGGVTHWVEFPVAVQDLTRATGA